MSVTTTIGQLGLRVRLGRGEFADYHRLARYHYLGDRPATVHSVWRLTARPAGRPCSPLWRAGAYPTVAGVLVVSYPVLQAKARNVVTANRYCTRPGRREGFARLNREVLTISRVVIHPLYRGLGLATRLVAGVLGRLESPLVEAFARMGSCVPFFARAGMSELALPDRPVYYYRFANDHLARSEP